MLDSSGNPRIDFVWGSFPVQPNEDYDSETDNRLWWSLYPGDGMAEYYLNGHATKEEFEQQFGQSYSDRIKYQQGKRPALRLDGRDGAPLALKKWNGFPNNEPEEGITEKLWFYDESGDHYVPAFRLPNIIGLDLDEAKAAMISCGLDPQILVPIEFDAPEEYRYSGYQPGYGYYNPVTAPGSDFAGVIMFRYMSPETVVGQHWDGSPAYAREFNNKVQYLGWSPNSVAPAAPHPYWMWDNIYSYPHSFLVIQTEDPRYNSYLWWD